MEAVNSSETPVTIYQLAWHHMSEDFILKWMY